MLIQDLKNSGLFIAADDLDKVSLVRPDMQGFEFEDQFHQGRLILCIPSRWENHNGWCLIYERVTKDSQKIQLVTFHAMFFRVTVTYRGETEMRPVLLPNDQQKKQFG